jgi:hypothetical protein
VKPLLASDLSLISLDNLDTWNVLSSDASGIASGVIVPVSEFSNQRVILAIVAVIYCNGLRISFVRGQSSQRVFPNVL